MSARKPHTSGYYNEARPRDEQVCLCDVCASNYLSGTSHPDACDVCELIAALRGVRDALRFKDGPSEETRESLVDAVLKVHHILNGVFDGFFNPTPAESAS